MAASTTLRRLTVTTLSVPIFLWSAGAAAVKLKALEKMSKLQGPFVQAEVHLSVLSDAADRALLAGAFGYAFKGGYRYKGWGFYLHIEQDFWVTTELDAKVVQGAVNIGFGVELTYARGFVRSAFALGPSILAFDTALDKAGSTGVFFDLRPVGLRFTVHRYIVIGLDPLTFTMVAPVLDEIPLINIEYRTVVYVEGAF